MKEGREGDYRGRDGRKGGWEEKLNCSLNKIILPINPSLKLLPFFPPPPFLPFPPSSSSPSCPRSRFVRLRTCDSVRGLLPKVMCLITGISPPSGHVSGFILRHMRLWLLVVVGFDKPFTGTPRGTRVWGVLPSFLRLAKSRLLCALHSL